MEASGSFSWLEFHQTLTRAGITSERANFQRKIGELVEATAGEIVKISGDSYYDWMMTGSYVEGWGNHLFRLDGVTGRDSDIDWSQVVKHKVYHLNNSCKSVVDCINRKDYELVNGHIDVKNCSLQPAFATARHGLRPDADECHAYPCCSYPKTVLEKTNTADANEQPKAEASEQPKADASEQPTADANEQPTADANEQPAAEANEHNRFLQMLKEQFDNENPQQDVHFVRASVPGKTNQMRLSCTRQERYIMSQLTTVQGQLFTVLKYLFKNVLKLKIDSSDSKGQFVLKSFHAKTLLMTQLRKTVSWPEEELNGERVDEANARLLEKLVFSTLNFLKGSVEDSIKEQQKNEAEVESNKKSSQQQQEEKEAATLKVLNHALLSDCGLYMKVKKENKNDKSPDYRPVLLEALNRLTEDRPTTLSCYLLKYHSYIEDTLKERGMPTVKADPNYSGGNSAPFLFVPLLMLPRINLDTLLEELLRGDRGEKSVALGTPSENINLIKSIKCNKLVTDDSPGPTSALLRDAYIAVWLILKSLTSPPISSQPDYLTAVCIAKKWVSKQRCLTTTHRCLQAMELMKEGKVNELKIHLNKLKLENAHQQPKRRIALHEDLDKLVQNEDCIWAFHYFVRPKEVMEFAYLKEVQDWNGKKAFLDGFDDECKDNRWLTPLMFHRGAEEKKKISQPSLTVNFDGLLCCFRMWASVSQPTDEDEFFKFMKNCLFEPRKTHL